MKIQKQIKLMTLAVLGGVMALGLGAHSARAIEKPKYEVLRSIESDGNDIEIRAYAPMLIAETVVEAETLSEASSEGFRRLAGFIFGGNRTRESVDMTAPVQSEKMDMTSPVGTIGEAGRYTISFVMPSKYTAATLPIPNDPRVQIREIPARKVAALVFSGFWSSKNFARHTEALKAYLRSEAVETIGEAQVARYNMPITPWFLRRNEVLVEIR